MGIRLILVLLTLWGLYIIVRGHLARRRKSASVKSPGSSANTVKCKVCDTYLPEAEALQHEGEFFCSREHLTQQQNDQ
ncbi:PP0621 family protein [Sedimenticola thiotaurini]|uniref:PP0621 family protein n=1 Tax=Sedimenticola thiotaurini TaxID=1543721 RepID=UPI0018FFB637|nr:PP0621 family protein [Sedimenticola thiotaurini]